MVQVDPHCPGAARLPHGSASLAERPYNRTVCTCSSRTCSGRLPASSSTGALGVACSSLRRWSKWPRLVCNLQNRGAQLRRSLARQTCGSSGQGAAMHGASKLHGDSHWRALEAVPPAKGNYSSGRGISLSAQLLVPVLAALPARLHRTASAGASGLHSPTLLDQSPWSSGEPWPTQVAVRRLPGWPMRPARRPMCELPPLRSPRRSRTPSTSASPSETRFSGRCGQAA